MTSVESICIRCKNLNAFINGVVVVVGGRRKLISECAYGGKNAGDRKQCKRFKEAEADIITARIKQLKGDVEE